MSAGGVDPRPPAGRIRKLALYGTSRSVVDGLLGLRGVLLAGILGPQLFGVWALFRLILSYGLFVGLGLLRGMELEVARAKGDGQRPARLDWGRTAAGFTLGLFGAIALAMVAASAVVEEAWLRRLLWASAAGLLLERWYYYGMTYIRAAGSLRGFAGLELVQAVAQVALTLGLALLFGLEGAFIGFLVATVLALALVLRRAPFRPDLDPARLRAMLRVGAPLSVTLLLGTLLATVDRLILGAVAGIEALGIYAFAVSVAMLGSSAALIVRTVVFPDVYGRMEADGAAGVTEAHLEGTIRPFVLLLAPLVGLGALGFGPLVALLAPQYEAAVAPAGIFIFTGVAQGVVSLALLGVVATGRQGTAPILTAVALAVNAGLAFTALQAGLGLLGLAAGALVGRLGYALAIMALVVRATPRPPLATALSILWPIAWCALAQALVSAWQAPRDLAALPPAVGAYTAAVAPVLLALILGPRRKAP